MKSYAQALGVHKFQGKTKKVLDLDNGWILVENRKKKAKSVDKEKIYPLPTAITIFKWASQNRFARFLAVDGAQNRNRLIVFRRGIGRARETWRLDMGLGPLDAHFQVVEEDVVAAQKVAEEEVEGVGEWLVQDLRSQSMGVQNRESEFELSKVGI
ncbi:hypothetical protein POM88_008726 [Heracleum sosnowskyi]|uniref:Uncharacterized protein n=1 Tax=Heracleum sosnowskyi TaxID=360622 RepID=A0AAD8J9A0_9APIA|nr:hypothetical protein POM88_008726 [Heracleum sosnowskyi]